MKNLLLLLAVLLVCASLSYWVTQLPFVEAFNRDWVETYTRHSGVYGVLYFMGAAATLTAVGLPRQITALLAGYAFGFIQGLIISVAAATISCALTFGLSRYLAQPIIRTNYAHRIAKLDAFVMVNPFIMTILIRLMPFGNNLATNLVAGVSHIRAVTFIVGSMLGYIPQMTIFALMGNAMVIHSSWKIASSIGLLGCSLLLGYYLLKRYKALNVPNTD